MSLFIATACMCFQVGCNNTNQDNINNLKVNPDSRKKLNRELEKEMILIGEQVHVAVGYDASNCTVSKFNTDYIFVNEKQFDKSIKILIETDGIKIKNE